MPNQESPDSPHPWDEWSGQSPQHPDQTYRAQPYHQQRQDRAYPGQTSPAPQYPGQPQQYPGQPGRPGPAWDQQYAQQGRLQQGYAQQPPPPRKSRLGWILGGGVVVVLALAGGLAFALLSSSGDLRGDPIEASGPAAGAAHSPEAVASITPCSAPPELTGTAATQSSAGLTVTATMSPACPGGDIVSNSDFQVSVTAGGKNVAAGSFDLSADPVVLREGQRADVSFVFPPGAYWRPADLAGGQLAMAAVLGGGSGPVPDGAVQNPSSVTATGPAAPASGSADDAALSALTDISGADSATLLGMQGQWLPQISSKKVGLRADGITWDNQEILREFLENRARHPESLLLWSGDWGSFDSSDSYWVTVVGSPASTHQPALSWCVANNLDQEHCLAKVVNKGGGTTGTTKMQPG